MLLKFWFKGLFRYLILIIYISCNVCLILFLLFPSMTVLKSVTQ